MQPVSDELWSEIVALVARLVDGRYEDLGARAGRCAPHDLQRVVGDYGRTLVGLPTEARALVHSTVRADGAVALDVPLWTREEGRSDLELRLDARAHDGGWSVSIGDLLVP